jgi:hypothetical protein
MMSETSITNEVDMSLAVGRGDERWALQAPKHTILTYGWKSEFLPRSWWIFLENLIL